ncbi:MAG: hypothetical protein ACRC80_35095 [Waterburya sp.]
MGVLSNYDYCHRCRLPFTAIIALTPDKSAGLRVIAKWGLHPIAAYQKAI